MFSDEINMITPHATKFPGVGPARLKLTLSFILLHFPLPYPPSQAIKRTKYWPHPRAINFARVGAQKLWAGTVTIDANAKTGAHHHGHLESVIYVLKGKARMRWGEKLEFTAEAGPGDFIFVPPYVPHQERKFRIFLYVCHYIWGAEIFGMSLERQTRSSSHELPGQCSALKTPIEMLC
jgi:mannose-6-phosphate isomerase-like protein (cupin superfamily)